MGTQALQPVAQSGAVAVPKKGDVQAWLKSDQFKLAVAQALPKHLTPERFVRVALNAFMRTPKLMECTQESVFRCMLDLSALGLEADGRRAHLIPFKRNVKSGGGWKSHMECQLIVDYKGLVELAYRSGTISNIHADRVCENDEFDYDRGLVLRHRINFRQARGAAYAYYARVVFKDGTETAEVMTVEEVNAIRARSKSANDGPWVTDYDEMAKKTVFRRLSKWLTLSPEFRDALDKDDDVVEVLTAKPQRETASISVESFLPSVEENRGHDAAAGLAHEPSEETTEPPTETVPPAADHDPDAIVTDERAEEVRAARDASKMDRKKWEALMKSVNAANPYQLTNRAADLVMAELEKLSAAP